MADRRCPFCNELVPSTSITCPKCYRKIPMQEPEPVKEAKTYGGDGRKRDPRNIIALVLAIVPALFGFLGLGLIYKYRGTGIGKYFLIGGLVLFGLASLVMILGAATPLAFIIAIPLFILYVLAFLLSLLLTSAGTVFSYHVG